MKELKAENKLLGENNRKSNLDFGILSLRINSQEQKSVSNHVEIVGVAERKMENRAKTVEEIAPLNWINRFPLSRLIAFVRKRQIMCL